MKMLKTKNIGFRVVAGILSLVICFNTVFTTNLVVYAEEVPGVEANATHEYNGTQVTEGEEYASSSVNELIPTAEGNGMPTNLGDNNSEPPQNTTLGHYETIRVWVDDYYEKYDVIEEAVYKDVVVGYIPAHTEYVETVIPGYTETVHVPTEEVRTMKWVEEKVTKVSRWIPARTAYRNETTPGYWTSVSNTIPGHYETRSVYVPPKTTRVRIQTGSTYRYVTRTIPGKYESRRVWVASKTVSKRVYIPPKTKSVSYKVPGYTVYDEIVEPRHQIEVTHSIPAHTEYIWHDEEVEMVAVRVEEKEVIERVEVTPEQTVTKEIHIPGHYEPREVWISNTTEDNTESETNAEEIEDPLNSDEYDELNKSILYHLITGGKLFDEVEWSAELVTKIMCELLVSNALCDYATEQGWFEQIFCLAGFYQDSKGVYHTRQDAIQQYGGYNDFYDYIFKYATYMNRKKDKFNYNGETYILWAWKGDYLNLGAGAELGIYKQLEVLENETEHFVVDTDLAMPMTLHLEDKDGNEIIDYRPGENNPKWWVTGFNPSAPNICGNDLTATYTVDFSDNPGMFTAFYEEYKDKPESGWKFNEDTWTASLVFE